MYPNFCQAATKLLLVSFGERLAVYLGIPLTTLLLQTLLLHESRIEVKQGEIDTMNSQFVK